MSIALPGLMTLYTDGTSITHDLSPTLLNFGSFNWLGVPRLTFVLVPIIAITWYLLECTPFGRRLLAIRSNPRSSHLVGIDVRRTVLTSFALSGLLAGIAGILLAARAGSADSTTGPSYLFPALAAVMLGVTTIRPGRPNVLGAVVGVFFVAFAVSGLSLRGAQSWAPSVLNGAVLVCAAGLAAWIARKRRGTAKLF
jgi:ribose transport system permease protein